MSTGIPGFRVGMGPRGNYVHMGCGGLSYRTLIPRESSPRSRASSPRRFLNATTPPAATTHAPLTPLVSADVTQLIDGSSDQLLDELKAKHAKLAICPLVVLVAVAAVVMAVMSSRPTWMTMSLGAMGVGAAVLAAQWDAFRKTTVLFYEFDPQMQALYESFAAAMEKLRSCSRTWHIEASGTVHDRKYHAGASQLVSRRANRIALGTPAFVKSNIDVFAIPFGRQTLYFFPDRILVFSGGELGAVAYSDLSLHASQNRFIESESVPRDAKVVDRTWQYVNKSGGPDRRFKDNRELPVCLYEELVFMSRTGLQQHLQCSGLGAGTDLARSLATLSQRIPAERRRP